MMKAAAVIGMKTTVVVATDKVKVIHKRPAKLIQLKQLIIFVMERKRGSGFRRIFTVSYVCRLGKC